jgi:superoxide dismutase
MTFTLPALPYGQDALAPLLSPETIEYRNSRVRDVEAFWKLVDWAFVAAQLGRSERGGTGP